MSTAAQCRRHPASGGEGNQWEVCRAAVAPGTKGGGGVELGWHPTSTRVDTYTEQAQRPLFDIQTLPRYLNRVDNALKSTAEQTHGGPVTLLAHSAGGWLGRVYLLGFGTQDRITKFVTLGSPHLPPLEVPPEPPPLNQE